MDIVRDKLKRLEKEVTGLQGELAATKLELKNSCEKVDWLEDKLIESQTREEEELEKSSSTKSSSGRKSHSNSRSGRCGCALLRKEVKSMAQKIEVLQKQCKTFNKLNEKLKDTSNAKSQRNLKRKVQAETAGTECYNQSTISEDENAPPETEVPSPDVHGDSGCTKGEMPGRKGRNKAVKLDAEGRRISSRSRMGKGSYVRYSQESLRMAVDAVQAGMPFRAASMQFSIPKTTIKEYAQGKRAIGVKAGRRRSIPENVENDIVNRMITAAEAGFPLSKRQILLKVGLLAKKSKFKTLFRNDIPGDDYWRILKTRRPDLVFRNPKGTLAKRMNRTVAHQFYDMLEEVLRVNHLNDKPQLVWSADEVGIPVTPTPSVEVVKREASSVSPPVKVAGGGSGETVMLVVCANAVGLAMPPLCVVRGKSIRAVQAFATMDSPEGTAWTYHDDPLAINTSSVVGVDWFREVFLKQCGPDRPQVLIFDSHGSHEVIELLEEARRERIVLLALPPHAGRILRPLDRAVFPSFSKTFEMNCAEFMRQNRGHVVNRLTWPRILRKTWEEVMMQPELIIESFRVTGIVPFNRDAIPAKAFAPPANAPNLLHATASIKNLEESRRDDEEAAITTLQELSQEVTEAVHQDMVTLVWP